MAGYVPESGATRAEPWKACCRMALMLAILWAQREYLRSGQTFVDARPDPKSALQGLAEENPANAAPRNPPTRRT